MLVWEIPIELETVVGCRQLHEYPEDCCEGLLCSRLFFCVFVLGNIVFVGSGDGYYRCLGSGATWCLGIFKKKYLFFSADTLTRALTRTQVRRPQSARVKVHSHLPASLSQPKKKVFFFLNPKEPRWPRFPGIDSTHYIMTIFFSVLSVSVDQNKMTIER